MAKGSEQDAQTSAGPSSVRALVVVGAVVLVLGAPVLYVRCLLDRTPAFKDKIAAGQPIVSAIEAYSRAEGTYPTSLEVLVPKYLAELPALDAGPHAAGWEYRLTPEESHPYELRHYMGRGGVEYRPPNWYGNDEGHRELLVSNAPGRRWW